ncbi:glycosyltransferase family 1 protein, partial [bacterium]|nr:glycosyltransferase family 1 protein [bacterium]
GPPRDGLFTTIMNWQSHPPITFDGRQYGQKDVEFAKFIDLPRRSPGHLEIAVAGQTVPRDDLRAHGWRIRDAHEVTLSFDSFRDYLGRSQGEFSVCKNVFVDTRSGWFSDRSAAYLASGRPVVLQETGFSAYLPCGAGLFAVNSVDEAAEAIGRIAADYPAHSRRARQIAGEHLEASTVLAKFLDELGC